MAPFIAAFWVSHRPANNNQGNLPDFKPSKSHPQSSFFITNSFKRPRSSQYAWHHALRLGFTLSMPSFLACSTSTSESWSSKATLPPSESRLLSSFLFFLFLPLPFPCSNSGTSSFFTHPGIPFWRLYSFHFLSFLCSPDLGGRPGRVVLKPSDDVRRDSYNSCSSA